MVKNYFFILFAVLITASGAFADDEAQEATAQVSKKLPIGADLYMSNNVGASTVSAAYEQGPYVASWLYLYPYFKSDPFWGEREFRLQTELSTSFEWLGKDNPFPGKFSDKLTFGDFKVRAELKKALEAKELGLSLSPAFKLEAPLSKASRDANRVIGLGGYLSAAWSKWGFFLKYKPVAMGYIYSAPYKSGACTQTSANEDKLADGDCKVAGRQTMLLVKNGVFTGYNGGNHTITLGFRSYHSFLRQAGSGEKPEKSASSGIMEATLGLVEYSYDIQSRWPTTLTLGVSSYQNPYDMREAFRAPFFDFTEPGKNLTEAYLAVNVSI